MNLNELEARALALMKAADFGDESVRVNEAIVALAPANDRAWTRLGRCHFEHRRFDEAIEALRTALSLNRTSTIATNLLNEVRKRRALTPTAAERTLTGFTAREFAMLETLAPAEACEALRSRIDQLVDAVNAAPAASRIVEARRRNGAAGSKLFHANSCRPIASGGIEAFHHGGRWEPQFSLGWFTQPSCVRIGLGFNTSAAGGDPERDADRDQVLRYFERFQRTIAVSWTRELARWMEGNGGFIQRGTHGPELSMQPAAAVEWLLTCRNAAAVEWIFVGRWLFLDRPDDAALLRDRAKLARTVDDTFRALLPLWLTAYNATR